MDHKKNEKSEIVSFNEQVPELSNLLELDSAELERVLGGGVGAQWCISNSCGTYGRQEYEQL